MNLLLFSSNTLRVEGLERVEEGAISLVGDGWMEEDEEDKDDEKEEETCAEFLWATDMLGFAKLEEAKNIISKVIYKNGDYKMKGRMVKAKK